MGAGDLKIVIWDSPKNNNENAVCQIGHKLQIDLRERVLRQDEDNDLIVFFLHEHELKDIAKDQSKSGFRRINADIENLIKGQEKENPKTWFAHFAGFSGFHKITEVIDPKVVLEDFGIDLFPAPATYHFDGFLGKKDKVSLSFSDTRKAIEKGHLEMNMGDFTKGPMNFGGISGGPVFARVFPYEDDLALLGIIYEGSGLIENCFLPEVISVRPITLIQHILEQ